MLEVAIKVANVRERAAKDALKMLLERLGEALAIVKLPGPGQPLAYRLKAENEAKEPESPVLTARLPQMPKSLSETEKSLGQTPTPKTQALHQTSPTPTEVVALHKRFKAGELKGTPLKIPGGNIPDLHKGLEGYFSKARLTDTERHDLLGIAQAVLAQTERETVGV